MDLLLQFVCCPVAWLVVSILYCYSDLVDLFPLLWHFLLSHILFYLFAVVRKYVQ